MCPYDTVHKRAGGSDAWHLWRGGVCRVFCFFLHNFVLALLCRLFLFLLRASDRNRLIHDLKKTICLCGILLDFLPEVTSHGYPLDRERPDPIFPSIFANII